jgi:hypothetical protein
MTRKTMMRTPTISPDRSRADRRLGGAAAEAGSVPGSGAGSSVGGGIGPAYGLDGGRGVVIDRQPGLPGRRTRARRCRARRSPSVVSPSDTLPLSGAPTVTVAAVRDPDRDTFPPRGPCAQEVVMSTTARSDRHGGDEPCREMIAAMSAPSLTLIRLGLPTRGSRVSVAVPRRRRLPAA